MPSLPLILAFMAATLALNFTPGADMAYVIARSLGQGRRAGVISTLAITAGCCAHIALATLGLAALLAQEPLAFRALQYAGAAYLLFIAWRLLTSGPTEGASPAAATSARRIFLQGVVTNVLNPKVALFILAFLPQFVDPARGPAWIQMLFLGALFCVSGTIVNASVALIAARAGRAVGGSAAERWVRRVSAGIFALLAFRLAFGGRS